MKRGGGSGLDFGVAPVPIRNGRVLNPSVYIYNVKD